MTAQSPNDIGSSLGSAAGFMPCRSSIERRGAARLALPFPATVRGMDQQGDRFTVQTLLDNLSSTGLYLRMARSVEPGTTLFVVVRLSIAPARQVSAPSVAARCVVLRAERRPGGEWGIALAFTHHRFLYAVL